MTLPLMGAREGEPSALDRAAALDQIAATIGVISPSPDVSRAVRILQPFPGNPDALDAAADEYARAGRDLRQIADQLGRDLASLGAEWAGDAASAATAAGHGTGDAARTDAEHFEAVDRALRELAAGLKADRTEHTELVHALTSLAMGLAVTGPVVPALRDEAITVLRRGAALLRRIHDRDQDAAARLRRILGGAAPVPTSSASVPVDGGRVAGLDAPGPGQSGVQVGWGAVTTVTLNDADTTALTDTLNYAGPGMAIGGAALGSAVPPLGVAIALLGGAAALGNQLVKDHRTPQGVRLTIVAGQLVAVTGR